jgi:hypothetical protein
MYESCAHRERKKRQANRRTAREAKEAKYVKTGVYACVEREEEGDCEAQAVRHIQSLSLRLVDPLLPVASPLRDVCPLQLQGCCLTGQRSQTFINSGVPERDAGRSTLDAERTKNSRLLTLFCFSSLHNKPTSCVPSTAQRSAAQPHVSCRTAFRLFCPSLTRAAGWQPWLLLSVEDAFDTKTQRATALTRLIWRLSLALHQTSSRRCHVLSQHVARRRLQLLDKRGAENPPQKPKHKLRPWHPDFSCTSADIPQSHRRSTGGP